jgi:hypothetical protein
MNNVGIFYGQLVHFGKFYRHLVYFVFICYILSRFGMLYHEKSGNPEDLKKYLTMKAFCHEMKEIQMFGFF